MLARGRLARGSEGDLPHLGPNEVGVAKRKRPPLLDLSSICSWQSKEEAAAPAPQLRQGSPRRNSCPLQPIAASPAAPERLIKRARRPGLVRCQSVPDFGVPLEDACESLALRDDCAPLVSPRPSSSRSAQAEALSALSAQMGSSSLYSPARTSARSSPDSVDAAG